MTTTGTATVEIMDYNYLIRTEEKYTTLCNALFDHASLNYDETSMVYDSSKVATVLRALEQEDYQDVLESLKEEAREKERERERRRQQLSFNELLYSDEEADDTEPEDTDRQEAAEDE